jgi:hypothetical protein
MLSDKDPLEVLQYRIFKWVLFIIFLASAYQLLDSHIHFSHLLPFLGR